MKRSLCWTCGAGTGFFFQVLIYFSSDTIWSCWWLLYIVYFIHGELSPSRGSKRRGPRFFAVVFFRFNTPLPPQLATFATLLVCLPSVSPAACGRESQGRTQKRRQQKFYGPLPILYISPLRSLSSLCGRLGFAYIRWRGVAHLCCGVAQLVW
jgi:hypothetical protein